MQLPHDEGRAAVLFKIMDQPQLNGAIPAANPKQTKTEIYDAYKKLLEQYKQNLGQLTTRQKQQQDIEEEKVVAKTAHYTVEKITKHVDELKQWMNGALDQLLQQLQQETQKLSEVRDVIALEKKNLEEVHRISTEATTLRDILAAQEEARRESEKERFAYEHRRNLERRKEETEH